MATSIQEIEVQFTRSPTVSWPIGMLVTQGQQLFFEYHSSWLRRNLELSPFILPVKTGLVEHQQRNFGPLLGLFDDSLPDGWGLLLMDRHFRSLGREPSALSPLDRLHDLLRAFRLMLFNILAHNRDDHVKNFSFILNDCTGQWSLAPAYDLTFSDGPGGEHSTTVAGEGRAPAYSHIAELAEQYAVAEKELEKMFTEVASAVERWPAFAQTAGVRTVVSAKISRRLNAVHFKRKG